MAQEDWDVGCLNRLGDYTEKSICFELVSRRCIQWSWINLCESQNALWGRGEWKSSMEMSVYFSVYLLLLCIIAFVICIVLVRKNELSNFFSFCTRNADRALLCIWTMSGFIFTFQSKQEGVLINYFSVITFIGIWFYSFVSCSVMIIFGNDNKGQRENLRCNDDVSKQSSSEMCVRSVQMACVPFCSLLHLLPRCLCSPSFRSSLFW